MAKFPRRSQANGLVNLGLLLLYGAATGGCAAQSVIMDEALNLSGRADDIRQAEMADQADASKAGQDCLYGELNRCTPRQLAELRECANSGTRDICGFRPLDDMRRRFEDYDVIHNPSSMAENSSEDTALPPDPPDDPPPSNCDPVHPEICA